MLAPLGAAVATLVALSLPVVAPAASAPASTCAEIAGAPGEPLVDPSMAAEFGPLAIEPALRVTSAATIADAAYVPGGVVVVTFREDEGSTAALSLVEETGAVRWQRCFEPGTYVNLFVASPPATPAHALMSVATDTGTTIDVVDLATGASTPADFVTADMTYAASADGWLLLQTLAADGSLAQDAALTFVDLATMTPSSVPAPAVPADITYPSFEVSDSGDVGLTGSRGRIVSLAYLDGAWTDDAGAIDEAFGVWTDYSSEHPATYWRASGADAWSVPDFYFASDEGFHDARSGDVQLLRGCTAIDARTYQCVGEALAGFDADDGTPLWSFDGPHWVPAAADGFALVGGPSADGSPDEFTVRMIDVATGDAVEGQVWPDGTFHGGCCGEPSFTAAHRGVVLTSDGNVLEVYVPAAAATPTVDVTL